MKFSVGANLVFAPFPKPFARIKEGQIQDSGDEYKIQGTNTRFAPTESRLPLARKASVMHSSKMEVVLLLLFVKMLL